jgi:hypothetical protein
MKCKFCKRSARWVLIYGGFLNIKIVMCTYHKNRIYKKRIKFVNK